MAKIKRSGDDNEGKFKKLKTQDDDQEDLKLKIPDHVPQLGKLYHLSKVEAIKDVYNQNCLGIQDILSSMKEEFMASAQFNYCFDINWLLSKYPKENRNKPLLIVHGSSGSEKMHLELQSKLNPNIEFHQAKLIIPFGTHHTKMMLLLYKSGLKIAIMTANMIEEDWKAKTQGIWLSPLFYKNTKHEVKGNGFSFKEDLLTYLRAYDSPKIKEWERHIEEHDLSTASVILVASTPGRHRNKDMWKWGHLKLRKALHAFGPRRQSHGKVANLRTVAQFSSIGSLGASKEAWLASEFAASLMAHPTGPNIVTLGDSPHNCSSTPAHFSIDLVFPTVDNVRDSLEGYMAGGSIPYSRTTHAKQGYLTNYMYQWRSDTLGRTRASPHIKSYAQFTEDGSKMAWFLLTSANLSKAAWGALEKKGSQLAIRSYELGVLFLPQLCVGDGNEWFDMTAKCPNIFLPYDYPLTKYTGQDSPWLIDVEHGINDKDVLGNTWPPE